MLGGSNRRGGLVDYIWDMRLSEFIDVGWPMLVLPRGFFNHSYAIQKVLQ